MRTLRWVLLLLVAVALCAWATRSVSAAASGLAPAGPTPVPQPIENDRLAVPVLPDHPSAYDLGLNVYYYNCMPCHGDRGQGLTDEFRKIWVEDHQNCWARGCHGGRIDDEGFPLPKTIPAVIEGVALQQHGPASEIYEYLRQTHPPQRPGALTDAEYRNVTEYLLESRAQPSSEAQIEGPGRSSALSVLVAFAASGLVLFGALAVQARGEKDR